MKYHKITLLFSILMILLTSNIASAITEGEVYTFSVTQTETYEIKSLKDGDLGRSSEEIFEYEISLEIIDVDEKENVLTYEMLVGVWAYSSPEVYNDTLSLNATEAGKNLFRIYASYNTKESGTEFLQSVRISNNFGLFTSTDWEEFNQGVSYAIDKDKTLYYGSDITFEDLLDEAVSYELMGEKTVADAQDKLDTDKKLKYEFVFDFSGAVTYSYYDEKDEETKYYDYDVYELSLSVEYDNDGVLSNSKMITKTEVITDSAVITSLEIFEISTDGLSGFIAGVPGFEMPIVILAIAIPLISKKLVSRFYLKI